MQTRNLAVCNFSEKVLYSSFLLLMGFGYLMGLAYLYTSHQNHDGKPGVSIEDIATNYYGNRSGTRLEAAIRGSMAGFIQPQERHHIIAWLKSGAPEDDFDASVRPVLESRCIRCHNPASGLKIPSLAALTEVREFARVDTGEALLTLVKLSHIHLFGIGLLVFGVGMVFRRARLPEWLRSGLLVIPFLAIATDVLAWFLTKWDPYYATVVVGAGAVLGLALAAQIVISLYQMWLSRAALP